MRGVSAWVGAATLPLVSHGAALVVNVGAGAWLAMPDRLRWSLAPDAVLFTTAAIVVAAPVAGVAIGAPSWNPTARRVIAITASAMVCAAVSSLLTFAWVAGREDALTFIAQSHLTLFAVTLALAAGGAVCAAIFRHPLDAAAVALVSSLVAAGGLLAAGATMADVPRPVIAIGLTASPLFAVASAAHIDIVRMDVPYQISPLAHMQMAYPEWASTSAWYLAGAALAFVGFAWRSQRAIAESRGHGPAANLAERHPSHDDGKQPDGQ
jgi:hypothetical protein